MKDQPERNKKQDNYFYATCKANAGTLTEWIEMQGWEKVPLGLFPGLIVPIIHENIASTHMGILQEGIKS